MKNHTFLIIIAWLICQSSFAFELYGHRGARGLAPENTLPGYALAIKLGVDYVDMDVAMTKDNILVLSHELRLDPFITRDKNGTWIQDRIPIKDLGLAELQSYDVGRIKPHSEYAAFFPDQQAIDGTKIPSLTQAVAFVQKQAGNKVKFQIEIKSDPSHPNDSFPPQQLAQALADIIHKQGITHRVEVQSFDWRCLLALQKIDPAIATAYLTNVKNEEDMQKNDPKIAGLWTGGYLLKNFNGSIPKMIKALGGSAWDPQDVTLTQSRLNAAHALGLKVVTWSSPSTSGKDVDLGLVKQQIAMGVDGIITDRPDKVKALQDH